jgi:SAM-dependent methyltransferase
VEAKPPGWAAGYARWFGLQSVADRYPSRPPYPEETFTVLTSLMDTSTRAVLDAGCGVGDLARPLAPHVERVDAIDTSKPMLVRGAGLPGGEAPNIRWLHGAIEAVPLSPPYGLIVCGDSVHWFDWPVAFARFVSTLTPHGYMAIAQREWSTGHEVQSRLRSIYANHGANRDFQPLDPVSELERRGLFERAGEHATAPVTWSPSLDALIACHHSQNGFVLEKMHDAAAFDRAVADVMAETVDNDGRLHLEVAARVVWGRPLRGTRSSG